jgi:LysM repeat protein
MIPSIYPIKLLTLICASFLLIFLVSCQSETEGETPTMQPTIGQPGLSSSPQIEPVETNTRVPDQPIEPPQDTAVAPTPTLTPLPTVTSPVPTPTSSPQPSPTPAPPPAASYYEVQAGDTLLAIAEQFGVSPEALAVANGFQGIDEFSLIAGAEIQIPLCQVHEVLSGNTLAGIAQMCAVTLDELIIANIASLASLGTFDAVPVGFALIIPQESSPPEEVDCTTQPAREQLIEYKPGPGEGIYCLSQKFTVSTTTILQANAGRLTGENIYGGTPLLIPPANGAIYEITGDDIIAGITLSDLAQWYELAEAEIFDWNGNPVEDPLSEGQGLYLPGANLIYGIYQAVVETEEETEG